MKVLHMISGGFFVDGRQYRTGDYVQEDDAAYPELAARLYPDKVLTKDTRVLELDTESEDYKEVVLTLPKYSAKREGQIITSGKKDKSLVTYREAVELVPSGKPTEIYGTQGIRSIDGETVEKTVVKVTLVEDKVTELEEPSKAADAPDLADKIDKDAADLDVPEVAKRGRRKS